MRRPDFRRALENRMAQAPTLISKRLERLPRFGRFILVGGLNTAFGYGLFGVIYLFTGRRTLAVVIATIIGVVFNFFSIGRLVFGYRRALAFVPFVLGYTVICLVNIAALDLLTGLGLHPLLGQLIILPACVVLSFVINQNIFIQSGTKRY